MPSTIKLPGLPDEHGDIKVRLTCSRCERAGPTGYGYSFERAHDDAVANTLVCGWERMGPSLFTCIDCVEDLIARPGG